MKFLTYTAGALLATAYVAWPLYCPWTKAMLLPLVFVAVLLVSWAYRSEAFNRRMAVFCLSSGAAVAVLPNLRLALISSDLSGTLELKNENNLIGFALILAGCVCLFLNHRQGQNTTKPPENPPSNTTNHIGTQNNVQGDQTNNIGTQNNVQGDQTNNYYLDDHDKGASRRPSLTKAFEEWSNATRPPLPVEFVVAGREEALARFHTWLAGPAAVLGIRAETRDEAVVFVYAAIIRLGEDERQRVLARSVVVKSIEDLRQLAESPSPMVLVADPGSASIAGAAVLRGHHVVVALDPAAGPSAGSDIELPRLGRKEAALALMKHGVGEEDAREFAALGRRGLPALRRRLAVHRASLVPAWAADSRRVLPAILAGSWNDANEHDRRAVAELAGRSYDSLYQDLMGWAGQPDPPVRLNGNIWTVTSLEDAWSLAARSMTSADAVKLQEVATRVLGERHPKFDLPESERWLAQVHGKVLQHSDQLRKGLTETVAMLATHGEYLAHNMAGAGGEWASRIVGDLLSRCTTWIEWASLGPALPLLAEAAPDRFREAVDRDLNSDHSELARLFTDTGDRSIGGHSPHTEVLWALEILAWSPEYLSDAALLLGRYSELDPGGWLTNRPLESLRRIFLLWHPSTAASLERRLRTLQLLLERKPEVGWHLLLSVLPTGHSMTHDTAKPRWRDWVPEIRPEFTDEELARGVHEVVSMALSQLGASGTRWSELLEIHEYLPASDIERIFRRLVELDPANVPPQERIPILQQLRHLVARHREFADAAWALPTKRVEQLEAIMPRFEPTEVIPRHLWLFAEKVVFAWPSSDWKGRQRAIDQARIEAIKLIHQEFRDDGILQLAKAVEDPEAVGSATARARVCENDDNFAARVVGSSDDVERRVGFGFVIGRLSLDDGIAWHQQIRHQPAWQAWPLRKRVDFYLAMEFAGDTWDQVAGESEETERSYWKQVKVGYIATNTDCWRAVRSLVKIGRHASAVQQLVRWENLHKGSSDPDLIVEVLEALVKVDHLEADSWENIGYGIAELLRILTESRKVEILKLATLEWQFLPIWRHFRKPQALHHALTLDPGFFVQVLSLVYRAEGDQPKSGLTEEQQSRALAGDDLLSKWARVPGSREDGSIIDAEVLSTWVASARQMSKEVGRLAVADIQIGRMLARAPIGTDGVWPHEAVRRVIEDTASENLQRGFQSGTRYLRGTVVKSEEGGDQERALAERYRRSAVVLNADFPRTARVLTRIVDSFQSDARHEDVRATLQEWLLD